MPMTDRVEQAVEQLYRVHEFRCWVQTNVLFPTVPDAIVHPLVSQLRQAEHALLGLLYDHDAIGCVAAIQKTLQGAS